MFLQERLPQRKLDITNPEDRKHFNYGILAGVTLALVRAFNDVSTVYDPSKVLYGTVPDAWEGYDETSRIVNSLLAEVKTKIQPVNLNCEVNSPGIVPIDWCVVMTAADKVTSLIDSLCRLSEYIEACNIEVHNYVIKTPLLSRRAKLLLQVAKAATILTKQENLLDGVASSDAAVPYLFKLVESTPYEIFIAELTRFMNSCGLGTPSLHRRKSDCKKYGTSIPTFRSV